MVKTKKKTKSDEKPDPIGRGRRNRDRVGIGFEDITPERLAHAARDGVTDHLLDDDVVKSINEAHEKHRGFRRVEAERTAEDQGAPVNPRGVRHVADPFDLLRNRGLLDKNDPAVNQMLWFAGDKYRRSYHTAGMVGVAAMDLTRATVDNSGVSKGPSSNQKILDAREDLRKGNVAIGPRSATLFCAIVLHGQTIADQRHLITDSSNERTADALALERLRDCLHRLCRTWGMRAGKSQKIQTSIGEDNMRKFERQT